MEEEEGKPFLLTADKLSFSNFYLIESLEMPDSLSPQTHFQLFIKLL